MNLWEHGDPFVLSEIRRLFGIMANRTTKYQYAGQGYEGFIGDLKEPTDGTHGALNDKEDGLLYGLIQLCTYALTQNPDEHPDNLKVAKQWNTWAQENIKDKWGRKGLSTPFEGHKNVSAPLDRIAHPYLATMTGAWFDYQMTGDKDSLWLFEQMMKTAVHEFRDWKGPDGVVRKVWRTAFSGLGIKGTEWKRASQIHLGPYMSYVALQVITLHYMDIAPFNTDGFMQLMGNSLEHSLLRSGKVKNRDGSEFKFETYKDLFGPDVSSLDERKIRSDPYTTDIGDKTTGPIMATEAMYVKSWFKTFGSWVTTSGPVFLPWMSDAAAKDHEKRGKGKTSVVLGLAAREGAQKVFK